MVMVNMVDCSEDDNNNGGGSTNRFNYNDEDDKCDND